jgi:hypothetical protein
MSNKLSPSFKSINLIHSSSFSNIEPIKSLTGILYSNLIIKNDKIINNNDDNHFHHTFSKQETYNSSLITKIKELFNHSKNNSDKLPKTKQPASQENKKNKKMIFFCSFGCKRKEQCKNNTLFYSTQTNLSKNPLKNLVSSIYPSFSNENNNKSYPSFSSSSSSFNNNFLFNNIYHYQRLNVFK